MKKIFALVLCIFYLSIFCITAYCATPYEYGDSFFSLKMNGTLNSEDFWCFYQGKNGSEISAENAYEGKTSLKCNIDEVQANYSDKPYPFNFQTREKSGKYGISDNDIYFEVFTNSSEAVFNNLTFVVYFNMPDSTTQNVKAFVSEDVGGGWKKSSCVINTANYSGYKSCQVGVLFKKNTNLSGCFYVDNINMKLCPVSLKVNDVYASGDSADLSKIRVFGIDRNGVERLINSNELMKWRITDGDAQIVDNRVVYQSDEPGSIEVEADFLGKKTTFSICFDKNDICITSMPVIENNTLLCSVANNSSYNTDICACILIYDGDVLYNAYFLNEGIDAGEEADISKAINIPSVLNNPVVKFLYWDNSGDISEIYNVRGI